MNERILNAKVSEYAYQIFCRIAKKKGLTVNEMMKAACECLVRYMSDAHNLTPELEQMMSVFEHGEWKDSINLLDVKGEYEIVGSIYFIQEKGKKGVRPIMVDKPFFNQWTQNVNVVNILERFICECTPDLYKRLRLIGSERGISSAFETIFTLCALYGEDAYDRYFREEFEDANRSEYGLKPHEGSPFRRKHHKDVDTQTGLDFRPHGGEW